MVLEGPLGQRVQPPAQTHCDCCRQPASEFKPIPEYDEGAFWRNALVCPTCFTEIKRLERLQQEEEAERSHRLWLEYR